MLNVLLFIGTFLVTIIWAFSTSPVSAFLLYQAVYFFNPQDRWWGEMVPDLRYSFITVVLMAIVFVLNYRKLTVNKIGNVPQFKWLYGIVLLYALVTPIAVWEQTHSEASINLIKLAIIMTIAYKLINTAKDLDWALWGYVFGAWYLSFLSYQTGRNRGDRLEGIGMVDAPDANGAAAALVPSLVICLHYFWSAKTCKQKAIFVVAGAFIANALVLINSRGAFLGAAASGLYFIWILFKSKEINIKNLKLKLLGIVFIGVVGVFSVLDEAAVQRILSIQNTEITKDKESGTTRLIFWKAAVDMSFDYPFGKGARAFVYYGPTYIPYDVVVSNRTNDKERARMKATHSAWFEALTDIGYPGLLCLVMMLISCYRTTKIAATRLLKNQEYDAYFKVIAIQGALLGFVVTMTFLNRFRAEILYWCVLFCASAYNIYVLKPQDKSVPTND